MSESWTHFVGSDEACKDWEENGRRCRLGTLTKIAHHSVVGLLAKEEQHQTVTLV